MPAFADEVLSSRIGCNIVTISLSCTAKRRAHVPTFTFSHTFVKADTHSHNNTNESTYLFHTGYPRLSSLLQLDWTSGCYVSVWIKRNYGGLLTFEILLSLWLSASGVWWMQWQNRVHQIAQIYAHINGHGVSIDPMLCDTLAHTRYILRMHKTAHGTFFRCLFHQLWPCL